MAASQPSAPSDVTLLCSRLRDFFSYNTPWHRRLWNVGTVLGLREVAEYAEACLRGDVSSTEGLRFVIETSQREVARDPGVSHLALGLQGRLEELNRKSPKDLHQQSLDHLQQLILRAATEYLHRWLSSATNQPVEFTARAIAAHLLDGGLSSDHLHRWLQKHQANFSAMKDVTAAVAEMADAMPPQAFQVFVPCSAPYTKPLAPSGAVHWLDGQRASRWLRDQPPESADTGNERINGAFVVSVCERDPWTAVDAARTVLARADARAKVARLRDRGLSFSGWARVAGSPHVFRLYPVHHNFEIGSLDRQEAIYRFDGTIAVEIDDSLELASYIASDNAGAAITGGWAAVEGLLIRPGERQHHHAADRLAALVTCSLPRAEMTPLAYAHAKLGSDELAKTLQLTRSNYEKVQLVEQRLQAGGQLALERGSDVAAQERIKAILADPAAQLDRIRRYAAESLRRLYNQRNVIAHSGSFRSAALAATARTSFCLVGAGLDRIVHAQLEGSFPLPPLELVARAEVELDLVGTDGGRSPSSLLE